MTKDYCMINHKVTQAPVLSNARIKVVYNKSKKLGALNPKPLNP